MTRPRSGRVLTPLLAAAVLAPGAHAQLQPENVLLVWNSTNADSQAVRDLYIAARPGVLEFDLNDPTLPATAVNRADYVGKIQTPIEDFINGVATGQDLSEQVIALVLTRGLPSRVNGSLEFELSSTFASVDSELTLLQQDLEQPGAGLLPFRYSGQVENPYHFRLNQPITGFTRALVKLDMNWQITVPAAGFGVWDPSPFAPGQMYLVTRLDAAPNDAGDQIDHIEAMLERSKRLVVVREQVQALLDEFPASANQFDDDGVPPIFPTQDDFGVTAAQLNALGVDVLHDQTIDFITAAELEDQCRPLVILGSYGENHDVGGGQNPPGLGTYATEYLLHPAGFFISYESFNGNSIVNGQQRADHQQALEFISAGGSFTIAHVNEPFTFAVADLAMIVQNMYIYGLTFAEAAYTAIPALSWVNVAVGDALARYVLISEADLDFDASGANTVDDLYAYHAGPTDLNDDGAADRYDAEVVRDALRFGENCDDVTVAQ